MMTTISDDSFSDDAHNVRKRSEINIDCMLCFTLCRQFSHLISHLNQFSHLILLSQSEISKTVVKKVQKNDRRDSIFDEVIHLLPLLDFI